MEIDKATASDLKSIQLLNHIILLIPCEFGIDRQGQNTFRLPFGHGKIARPVVEIPVGLLEGKGNGIVNTGTYSGLF
jgi:hypothetical protein